MRHYPVGTWAGGSCIGHNGGVLHRETIQDVMLFESGHGILCV